jgi:hypothetical protein
MPLLRYADLEDSVLVEQARAIAEDMLREAPEQRRGSPAALAGRARGIAQGVKLRQWISPNSSSA